MRRSRLGAHEYARTEGEAEASRQGARDQFRLVVAAFTLAANVQRDGDNGVSAPFVRLRRDDFRETASEPVSKPSDFVVLHHQDRARERIIIDREGTGALEGVEVRATKAAEGPLDLGRDGRGERPAADLAHRIDDALERSEAGVADRDSVGAKQRVSADATRRWKKHRGQCVERVPNGHGCVVNREDNEEKLPQIAQRGKQDHSKRRRDLEEALLHLFLAGNAVEGPRHRFEALLL